MAKGIDFEEAGDSIDDFYKKKTHHPDYDGEDIEDDYIDNDFEKDSSEVDDEILEDKWYDIEKEYRSRYPNLTDEDVNVKSGQFQQTVDRISGRRGRTPREIRTEIENW